MAILRLSIATVYFLFASLTSLILFILRPCNAKNIGLFTKIVAIIPKYLLGLKLEVEGKEFLESNRPCVFICNHQSSMDLLTAVWLAPSQTVSLGKKSLKYFPLFGQLYWLSGNILINRENIRKSFETIKLIGNRINKEKLSIWIFPEGTRNYGKGLLPFKSGAFKIAEQANIPIIPVCIATYNFNLNRLKSGVLRIKILPPIITDGDPTKTRILIHAKMKETISSLDQKVAQP